MTLCMCLTSLRFFVSFGRMAIWDVNNFICCCPLEQQNRSTLDSPLILLIDELNQLEGMNHHHPGNVEMENLAAFLKKHFLTNDKQYFVFSSPDISSLNPLSEFMIWLSASCDS
mmetsp:Transcript_8898/g.12310  ORF Transcript_8898/g.12310 Transcript_8898/m.12310 type:complete len:114 (-) Transcript_8898:664-1005(-)